MISHTRRIGLLLIVLFAMLPLMLTSAQDTSPTTLTVGSTLIIDALNPTVGYYGYNVRSLFYETLIEAADGNNVEPGLAETWDVSDDGLAWTFKIREGATFSDGTPVTAVEAAWTINWIIENEVPTLVSYLNFVTGAEAPDPTTLLINLSEPVSNMISSKLLYIYILPPHIWEGMSAEEITLFDDPQAVTTGAGPYKLVDYQADEFMILEANPNYWRGAPPVQQIIYRQYSNDDALIEALRSGEVDVIPVLTPSGVFPLQSEPTVTLLTGQVGQFATLTINSAEDGIVPASLKDPVVRQAMDYAIDRQQIITIAYLGYAQPATTFIPTSMGIYHNTDIHGVPYDIAEANRILDEAGYADTNGDGIREDAEGNPLEFRLFGDDCCAYYVRILEIISDGLAQIGISAIPVTQSTDFLISLQIDYDFDIILYEWAPDTDPHFMTSVFTCDETADGGWNDSGYCNPTYDDLFNLQATALDTDSRQAAIWDMQQLVYHARPWLMLAYTDAIAAYRSDRFTFSPNLPIALIKWSLFHDFAVL